MARQLDGRPDGLAPTDQLVDVLPRIAIGSRFGAWELCRPRADPADSLHRDVKHAAGRWIAHWRERDVRPEVDVGESLQQFRGSAFDDSCPPVDDEVLLQTGRLDVGALDREGDARVASDVP